MLHPWASHTEHSGRSSLPVNRQTDYRAEIDGLRALAVLAVIFNHLQRSLLPSGFLGVDIFFVISGFVITASLYDKPKSSFGEFVGSFFARRVKRLAPSLIFCILTTSILAWLIVPAPGVSLQTGMAALFGLSNIALYLEQIDYFSPSRDLNLFTQTWSLGVEEQFYLVFPLIFWLTGFARKQKGYYVFAILLSAASVMSLGAYLMFATTSSEATYFLMPFRFWELGAGSILFTLSKSRTFIFSEVFTRYLSLVAFGLLVSALFLSPAYRIASTVAAVALTVMVIALIKPRTPIYALLSHPAVVYVGLISYPLYLWHWSIFSLSRWTIGMHSWTVPFQLVAIFLLAAGTYAYIERPLRRARWLPGDWRTIAYGTLGAACCAFFIVAVLSRPQVIGISSAELRLTKATLPPPFLFLKRSGLYYDPYCVVDGNKRLLGDDTFSLCTVPPSGASGQTIWTLGDSHAGHLQGLLHALHDQIGIGIHLIETPGVVFPMAAGHEFLPRQRIYQMITARLKPHDIVLVSRLYLPRKGGPVNIHELGQWSRNLKELSSELSRKQVKLVVMGPPPMFDFDAVSSCLSLIFEFSTCDVDREVVEKQVNAALLVLAQAARESGNIIIFNPFPILCPEGQWRCSPIVKGELLFRDREHLNSKGAANLANDFITFLHKNDALKLKQTVADSY
jgi:peptidoglycan/LPS O-acetylase OafA/YrhL